MREAKGDMLEMDCDALVITTNGFVTSSGNAVMGRGIAKAVSDALPWMKQALGMLINKKGNVPHILGYHSDIALVSFPVKPYQVVCNGNNIVEHAKNKYLNGDVVPGFYAKADIRLIIDSCKRLVELADNHPTWQVILVPRFGCGAGELDWKDVKPVVEELLDDRFIACTF